MKIETEIILQEWATRVGRVIYNLIPPSSENTPRSRKEAALAMSLKSFDLQQERIETLEAYIVFVDKVLANEEVQDGS
tara:strand:+ start:858 stop:1091 length:234 start_codon:yes stop_codon:yes gene_type:complete